MKKKIIYTLIVLVLLGIVIGWTFVLEWMSPGMPFQAFFSSLIMLMPLTVGIIYCLFSIFMRIKLGLPLWEMDKLPQPKPKLPLIYRFFWWIDKLLR